MYFIISSIRFLFLHPDKISFCSMIFYTFEFFLLSYLFLLMSYSFFFGNLLFYAQNCFALICFWRALFYFHYFKFIHFFNQKQFQKIFYFIMGGDYFQIILEFESQQFFNSFKKLGSRLEKQRAFRLFYLENFYRNFIFRNCNQLEMLLNHSMLLNFINLQ